MLGNAISTEFVDASSNATIYQRVTPDGQAYSSYYYVDANGKQVNINSPRPRDSVIRQNYERHAAAVNDSLVKFESQNPELKITTEVTFRNPNNLDEGARIDGVMLAEGRANQQIDVPEGFIATDIDNNVVTKIQLDDSGYAGVEMKTGGAGLERNQYAIYSQCESGCAISVGENATEAGLTNGATPTKIYILRPIED